MSALRLVGMISFARQIDGHLILDTSLDTSLFSFLFRVLPILPIRPLLVTLHRPLALNRNLQAAATICKHRHPHVIPRHLYPPPPFILGRNFTKTAYYLLIEELPGIVSKY